METTVLLKIIVLLPGNSIISNFQNRRRFIVQGFV